VKDKQRWVLLLALIVGALALVAAGCGADDDDGSASELAAPTEEPAAADPAEEPTAAPGAGIKVGLVTDTGGVNDGGFNQSSIAGLDQAMEELGIEGRVYISGSEEDYRPNLLAAAEAGNDLVFAIGSQLTAQTIEVATAFPDVSFAGVDQFYNTEGDGFSGCEESLTCVVPNALGLQYPSEEAGYLAGIVAAMTTKTGTISTVGGIAIPRVDSWIAGFQQGALSVNQNIKLLNAYSQDFVDPAKCKEIGIDQIALGSDVIFQVAELCGLGALDAAGEGGAFAIGVEADQSFKGDYVITSALKPIAASVFGTISSFVDDDFAGGGNFVFSVVDFPDSALLTDLSADVPEEAADAVAVATEQLISEEIDPTASVQEVGVTE